MATVLDAISRLPEAYRKPQITNGSGPICPVQFADAWVGVRQTALRRVEADILQISGCDTGLDQKRMSDLLSPFL